MAKSRAACECAGCGQFFKTEVSFNLHRTGSYGKPVPAKNGVTGYEKHSRRCMDEVEMKAKGLSLNDRGLWTTATSDEDTAEEEQEREEVQV